MSEVEHRLTADIEGISRVVGIRLDEALDRPYRLRLECRSLTDTDFVPADAIAQDVVLEIVREGSTTRRITGIVLGVDTERADGIPEGTVTLEVGPALSLLAQERRSRIFQDKKVPEILQEVFDEALGAYGRSIDMVLTDADYEPREYCVQWQETTLAFVSRLMAEEGIAYHFDHSGETEILALRDKNDDYADLEASDGASLTYAVIDTSGAAVIPEAVTAFAMRQRLGRTNIEVRDFDWTGPATPEDDTGEADAKGRERTSYEHALGLTLSIGSYDEGAARYQKNDSARQPAVRLEADQARLNVFLGRSTVIALQPGLVFELTGEPMGNDGRYLVTAVDVGTASGGVTDDTQNRFTCISVDVPHRPARTQIKPKITGAEVATVVGPSGEEIHTDKHGRIMVRFPWDRGDTEDDHATCWMRVSQRWAGGGFGALFIPRIGMEVVVRYVHGDPDRPLVTGAVYRGQNPPPYALPDEKTKSTIKSNTTIGGGGFNELRFEDKAGEEQIFLNGQRNCKEEVLNNHTTTVTVDQTNTVHNDQTQTIHTNQTEDVHGNQTMKVKSTRDVTVNSGFDETVGGTEDRTVKSGETELIFGGEKRKVTGAVVELVTGGETRVVVGGLTENNDATHTRVVIGGALRVDTGTFTNKASGSNTLKSGSMVNSLILGKLTAKGTMMVVNAPVILEISGSHKVNSANKSSTVVNRISLMGLAASATGFKLAKTDLSLSIAGAKAEATGISLGITGIKLDKTFNDKTSTPIEATFTGILLYKQALKAEN